MSYAFSFQNKAYTPDGQVEITDVDAHNREQEQQEIAHLKTGPDRVFLYVKHANALKDFTITTWLGTRVGSDEHFGPCVYTGFGRYGCAKTVK